MNPKQLHLRAHTLQLDAQMLALILNGITIPTPPDGYPTATMQPNTGTAELTPVEAAAHQRLGDLVAYGNQHYRPGPVTLIDDIAELIAGAHDLIRHAYTHATTLNAHIEINYDHLRCPTPHCTEWADPRRNDGHCIDHGRTIDSNARRHRRYRTAAAAWDTQPD